MPSPLPPSLLPRLSDGDLPRVLFSAGTDVSLVCEILSQGRLTQDDVWAANAAGEPRFMAWFLDAAQSRSRSRAILLKEEDSWAGFPEEVPADDALERLGAWIFEHPRATQRESVLEALVEHDLPWSLHAALSASGTVDSWAAGRLAQRAVETGRNRTLQVLCHHRLVPLTGQALCLMHQARGPSTVRILLQAGTDLEQRDGDNRLCTEAWVAAAMNASEVGEAVRLANLAYNNLKALTEHLPANVPAGFVQALERDLRKGREIHFQQLPLTDQAAQAWAVAWRPHLALGDPEVAPTTLLWEKHREAPRLHAWARVFLQQLPEAMLDQEDGAGFRPRDVLWALLFRQSPHTLNGGARGEGFFDPIQAVARLERLMPSSLARQGLAEAVPGPFSVRQARDDRPKEIAGMALMMAALWLDSDYATVLMPAPGYEMAERLTEGQSPNALWAVDAQGISPLARLIGVAAHVDTRLTSSYLAKHALPSLARGVLRQAAERRPEERQAVADSLVEFTRRALGFIELPDEVPFLTAWLQDPAGLTRSAQGFIRRFDELEVHPIDTALANLSSVVGPMAALGALQDAGTPVAWHRLTDAGFSENSRQALLAPGLERVQLEAALAPAPVGARHRL